MKRLKLDTELAPQASGIRGSRTGGFSTTEKASTALVGIYNDFMCPISFTNPFK